MRVHFIAVCGTAMASVAAELHRSGNIVTGSDGAFYPPMSRFLEVNNVPIRQGFDPAHLPDDGIIIVGNAVSRGNPELEAALDRNMQVLSLPEFIAQHYLPHRKSIVIAGTHGKTTTTSMLSFLLHSEALAPGYLIGGIPRDLPSPCDSGKSKFFVIEGDEYDTAWSDKRPKFLHYRPYYAVITSIEFDHADIYPDIKSIESAFRSFTRLLPRSGRLFAYGDDPRVLDVTSSAYCPVITYGEANSCNWQLLDSRIDNDGFWCGLAKSADKKELTIKLSVPGKHNLLNALAVIAVGETLQIDTHRSINTLTKFGGVERRLNSFRTDFGTIIYDDFAHHPTAIKATLESVRQMHPSNRIWALFEPRSNTMVRRFYQSELTDAMDIADMAVLGPVHRSAKIPLEDRLDRASIVNDLIHRGKNGMFFDDFSVLVSTIIEQLQADDVVVIMSNGSFGEIKSTLINELNKKTGN